MVNDTLSDLLVNQALSSGERELFISSVTYPMRHFYGLIPKQANSDFEREHFIDLTLMVLLVLLTNICTQPSSTLSPGPT